MKVSDYIVNFLIEKNITDVFGIPGGVVLDLLDSLNKREEQIKVHHNYHEQAAAFAAGAYAQVSRKLGVAYATKGPGATNLITGIADAYFDSIPVLFISAHSIDSQLPVRFEGIQELNIIPQIVNITKYAVRITKKEDVFYHLEYAYQKAVSGRPGPVFLDFSMSVLTADIDELKVLRNFMATDEDSFDSSEEIVKIIKEKLKNSKRPILLIGDGIRQSNTENYLKQFVVNLGIPVLSSRASLDILSDSKYYYGFIGRLARRHSNFILSKCDLLLSLGNRLAYTMPRAFENFAQKRTILRIDIDSSELSRFIPNTDNYCADLKDLLPLIANTFPLHENNYNEWNDICNMLKNAFIHHDSNYPVNAIANILKQTSGDMTIVSDVGHNDQWLSYAYTLSGVSNKVIRSRSFSVLGSSLPKAIGAYYATKKKVLCFVGDFGIQLNIQELNFIASEKLPIFIFLLNNFSSGVIRHDQKLFFASRFVHSTLDSGYNIPNFSSIAKAFGIPYFSILPNQNISQGFFQKDGPILIEMMIDENIDVTPILPRGCDWQNLKPHLEETVFKYYNNL
jgi:acetolactate synthase-1/2/3 large subunit